MKRKPLKESFHLEKAPTGIRGLDKITRGGLPAGRPTLVCGGPGCGKTVLSMEFLVRGALEYDEPGLFLSFEENKTGLIQNFHSMGFDLEALMDKGQLKISEINLDHGEIIEAGDFSLDGLFIQIEHNIDAIGARRIVLDTMGKFFSVLSDSATLRREISRLFDWLREKGMTAIITGERGDQQLTRHGLEEYVSDCVIFLDHRVEDQISKRRLRIVKYRGSAHGVDEYPFVIGQQGITVFPITSATLDHDVDQKRVSTGVESLDEMFGSKGYYKGSTVLVTGKAGTGKSSLSAAFVAAACERGERALYFAFEESPSQIVRNMRSVGLDLQPSIEKGLLEIHAFRPSLRGLEEHLISITETVDAFNPSCVVMDPISGMINIGSRHEVKSMLTRVLDRLKSRGVTLFFTSLIPGTSNPEVTESDISSLMDTWIALDYSYQDRTRTRKIYVVKSRGMDHSSHKNRFVINSEGLSVEGIETEKHQ